MLTTLADKSKLFISIRNEANKTNAVITQIVRADRGLEEERRIEEDRVLSYSMANFKI